MLVRLSRGSFPVLFYGLKACSSRKYQYKFINSVINSTFIKFLNTRSQETVDVCLEMFGCLQAERTIAIRKRKFLNNFSVTHNALCRVFVATAKTELESCCTDVSLSDQLSFLFIYCNLNHATLSVNNK